MRKDKLIESIRGIILMQEPNEDSIGKLHYKRVEELVNQAYATLMQQSLEQINAESGGLDQYATIVYGVAIQHSIYGDYIEIEDGFLTLKNSGGLLWVRPIGNRSVYGREPYSHIGIFASHPVWGLLDETFVRIGNMRGVEGSCVLFEHSARSWKKQVEQVDYAYIREITSYEDDEDISLPDNNYAQLTAIVLEMIGKRYTDNTNNDQ